MEKAEGQANIIFHTPVPQAIRGTSERTTRHTPTATLAVDLHPGDSPNARSSTLVPRAQCSNTWTRDCTSRQTSYSFSYCRGDNKTRFEDVKSEEGTKLGVFELSVGHMTYKRSTVKLPGTRIDHDIGGILDERDARGDYVVGRERDTASS